jgi:hypothetical protein
MKPCKVCGGTQFYKQGQCKACQKIYNAKRYAENPEKIKAWSKAWHSKNKDYRMHRLSKPGQQQKERIKQLKWISNNPEKAKAINLKWRNSNRHHLRKYCKKWRAVNGGAVRVYSNNRRVRKEINGGVLSAGLIEKLFELQRGKCPCCGMHLGKNYQLDHKMPLALGGSNEDWNMQLLRKKCNLEKHANHPIDFMQSRGFLL